MNFFDRLFPGFLSKARSIFGLNTLHASTQFNDYTKSMEKLAVILSNPALLKVFSLQCDLFSLGNVYVKDIKTDEPLPDDPFLTLIHDPNPFQSLSQFLWDFMFMTMMGTDYCYSDSKIVDKPGNKLYHLLSFKIEWPFNMDRDKDKLMFSDEAIANFRKQTITYRYDDGSTFQFPLDRLIITHDLTNGVGNWYKSPSRLDALYKVISNSEHALDAKNINVRYTGKFLVGSSAATMQTVGLSDDEKKDITDKMESDKKVFPLKTLVQIRRFVEDMGRLQLDEAYYNDFYIIGGMFNIPRDVLEASLKSSTYENQEKARMSHISYTLSPKGNEFFNSIEKHYGYRAAGKNICITWDHLPCMQVFQKDKSEIEKNKIESLTSLLSLGVPLEEANKYLGLDFTIEEPKPEQNGQGGQEETGASGEGQSAENQNEPTS